LHHAGAYTRCTTPVSKVRQREQPQRDRRAALVEQPHAVPDGEGLLEEVQLVDQAGGDELADDRHRHVQGDVIAGRVLERGESLDEVTLELSELRHVSSRSSLETTTLRASPSVLANGAS
jgi:hypothetical protein